MPSSTPPGAGPPNTAWRPPAATPPPVVRLRPATMRGLLPGLCVSTSGSYASDVPRMDKSAWHIGTGGRRLNRPGGDAWALSEGLTPPERAWPLAATPWPATIVCGSATVALASAPAAAAASADTPRVKDGMLGGMNGDAANGGVSRRLPPEASTAGDNAAEPRRFGESAAADLERWWLPGVRCDRASPGDGVVTALQPDCTPDPAATPGLPSFGQPRVPPGRCHLCRWAGSSASRMCMPCDMFQPSAGAEVDGTGMPAPASIECRRRRRVGISGCRGGGV